MKILIEKIKTLCLYFTNNHVIYAEYKDNIMTVKYERGKTEQYEGSCTVWHKLPFMKRCGTLTEGWLCDLWEYNKKWGGAYPHAHKHGCRDNVFTKEDMKKAFAAGARNGSNAGMRIARGGELYMKHFDEWFPEHY